MANKIYDNFYLSNEIADMFDSHLNLQAFCKIDDTLVGTAGMKRKINRYSATSGAEKLTMGKGNSKAIEVTYAPNEYEILLAQTTFKFHDEEQMTDPFAISVGTTQVATDLFNTVNADIFAEFGKTTQKVDTYKNFEFGCFADAVAEMNIEGTDNDPAVVGSRCFAFVNPQDMAAIRKALKDELKYVEAYARAGYVGTVAGVNLFVKKNAVAGECVVATRDAVTLFNKKGVEVETDRDIDKRINRMVGRKYYIAALTDETKAVKITLAKG